MRAALPDAAAEVLRQLALRGFTVPVRPFPGRIEFWWEAQPSPCDVRA